MKKILLISFALLFLLFVLGYWAGYNYLTPNSNNKVIKISPDINAINPVIKANPKELVVATWNISFFYGLGSEGTAYYPKDKSYFNHRLESAARLLKKETVDILFLQEVDFSASRSHYQDQLKELASKLGLPYIAYAISWDANYIPFPYWPLNRQFGAIKSGGGVISRYPIVSNKVELLPKPNSNPWWYNYFYLNRYLQKVEIKYLKENYSFINLHLEAFDAINRENQVKRILDHKDDLSLIAGDFNLIPDNALKRERFAGYPDDNYLKDNSFKELQKLDFGFSDAATFTFPAHRPDRKLDYILYNPKVFNLKNSKVLKTQESDHLPIISILEINN